jgi:long-chain acyl-CoA synthetase
MLQEAARQAGDHEALVSEGERLTYADYQSCAAGFAEELIRLGAAGERVALLMGNSIDLCIALFGTHAAQAVTVPLNPAYTERELRQILTDAQPHVLLYDSVSAAVAAPLAAELKVPHVMRIGEAGRRLDAWRGKGLALPPLPTPEQTACVQYTGGTTGRSKGVQLSHRSMAINVAQREAVLPTRTGIERLLCVMPLFHTYANAMCLLNMAACRGTLALVPRYNAETLLQLLVTERITIFAGSPTLFTSLMNSAEFAKADFSTLHVSYSGSSALPEALFKRWEEATGAPVVEGYGQTESGPVVSFNPLSGVRKPASVGVPLPETEVQIVDLASGETVLPVGERGEIRVRGPQVMNGYRNLPAETAAALRGGWLYTGDIGEFDADGYLYIRDRKKEMIKVSGFNVFPREVEEVLYAHPMVSEAAVIGLPDARKGERVLAYAVLRRDAAIDAAALIDYCRQQLAGYKVPGEIRIVDALPKTRVGKADKLRMRDIALANASN